MSRKKQRIQLRKDKEISFNTKVTEFDRTINLLSKEITKEKNLVARNLLVSEMNEIIISRNEYVEAVFSSPAYVNNLFLLLNGQIKLDNERISKKNLTIREKNPGFANLESRLLGYITPKVIALEIVQEVDFKMKDTLNLVKEYSI